MNLEEFQKERRDWWKTVYLETSVKVNEPKNAADRALRIFDKRFRQERNEAGVFETDIENTDKKKNDE